MKPSVALSVIADALSTAGAPDDMVNRVIAAAEVALGEARTPIDGLQPAEQRLVTALVKVPGRVIERHAAIDLLDSRATPDAIDRYVCRVRKKRPDIGRHIKTVWGDGYTWTGPALAELQGDAS